jgi:peptide/nickel transport system permease protein
VRHVVARLGQSLIVVFIVTTVSFFIVRTAPGDPFSYDATNLSQELRDRLRHQAGYDRPVPEQFVRYIARVAKGDLGYSSSKHMFVSSALGKALPNTLLLVGVALSVSIGLGMVIGVVQATKRGGWFDRVSSFVLLVFYSLPDFWAALMMLLVFGFLLNRFPQSYMVDPSLHDYMTTWEKFKDIVWHLTLPASTLTLITLAAIARYQRTAILEVLPSDYIRTARAKGLSERAIIWRHALRNALTPMITVLGLLFPVLIGGALFVEKVFSWPGMGAMTADAIDSRDYDLVTASVIVGSVMVIIGSLVADLLHAAVDPRVRE